MAVAGAPSAEQVADWQAGFTAAMPKMERVLRFRLRAFSAESRDEMMAAALSLCWENYLQLCRDGRDPTPLVGKIAQFAAMKVRSEHDLAGSRSGRDVLSYAARRRHGHTVRSIEEGADGELAPEVADALADGRAADPADEALARLHFREWLDGLDGERREMAEEFAAGLNNTEVGERHGRGRGSGSAWRRELRRSWNEFDGQPER